MPCADMEDTLYYTDVNNDVIMKDNADPHADGPSIYVDKDGKQTLSVCGSVLSNVSLPEPGCACSKRT